jgi:hypothetical protein
MDMKKTREGEELVKVGYRLPPDIILRLEKDAIKHRRSVNDEVITILEEYFAIRKILKDANMRDILASLANMPRNFGEYDITKRDLRKFFNTYIDVIMGLNSKDPDAVDWPMDEDEVRETPMGRPPKAKPEKS